MEAEDHNLLGALQLVAKTLEVWFMFVAGSLVYDLAMLLARNSDGLPLRYYTPFVEFGDLRSIISWSFWTPMGAGVKR